MKTQDIVRTAVQKASQKWAKAFNDGDGKGAAAMYEKDAVMNAKPFGKFNGRQEIAGFWCKLVDDGFSDVKYIDPVIEVVDEKSAILSSKWSMNKAAGVITKELWVLQDDGTALLKDDNFEAQG